MRFLFYALLGSLACAACLFIIGLCFCAGCVLLFFPGIFLIPYVGILAGLVGVLVECFVKQGRGGRLRGYMTAILMSELIGLLVLPVWTVFSPALEGYPSDWQARDQSAFNKYVAPRRDIFHFQDLGRPEAFPNAAPADAKYVRLANSLSDLCLLQGCVDNSFPFLAGFPAIVLLALWTRERSRRAKPKVCSEATRR